MAIRAGIERHPAEELADRVARPYRDSLRAILHIREQAEAGVISDFEAGKRIQRVALQQLGGKPG